MKRWIVSIGMAILLFVGAGQANAEATVNVVVDGSPMSLSKPAVTVNGYTIIPMKDIFEKLGASVFWDGDHEIVTARKEETNVQLKIGSPVAQVNGISYLLPVEAQIFEGRTMVPLRFVSQVLGCGISWDGDTFTAYVDTKSMPDENQKLDQAAIDSLVPKLGTESIVGREPNNIGLTDKEAMMSILLPDEIARKEWESLPVRSKKYLLYQVVQKNREQVANVEHCYTIVKFEDTILIGADITENINPDEVKLVDGNILLPSYREQQSAISQPYKWPTNQPDQDMDII
ncbi:copper amine oxidase N-terminal domain-containing protein [Paenibacillus larvae]|uniref:copper amine oxidase N-terminal domain-containing protein n=2 Tax=Paenibacillus larvae TaxID=1464 RepID=UPI00285388A1|nr:copper amine oxidase N-terminal domain-containing protein [Paenibacillus larvae]MDR5584269.1 copper amine oxidase N-terminal domain-containing protein [Paenibacillus larvae]MDR5600046.1 copper amine oxidase N-terminal domain-containing protein [Paenibacillus larvae]